MAGAAMAAAGEAEDGHARGFSRDDARRAVLDHQRARRLRRHPPGGVQENIRRRLAAGDLGGAEHRALEPAGEPGTVELLRQHRRRAAGRHAFALRQHRQGGGEAGHRLQLQRVALGRKPVHLGIEARRQGRAALALELGVHVLVAHADKALADDLRRERRADRSQRRGDGVTGDDLAVDENTVAIEDEEIESLWWIQIASPHGAGFRGCKSNRWRPPATTLSRCATPSHRRRSARPARISRRGWRAPSAHARHWAPPSAAW